MKFVSEGILVSDAAFLRDAELIDLAEKDNKWKDRQEDYTKSKIMTLNPKVEIVKEALDTIVLFLNQYGKRYPSLKVEKTIGLQIVKYEKDGFIAEHSDAEAQVSVILFLNEGYKGGSLFFKNQELEIEPKASRLVIYPANYVFTHKHQNVIEGTKYALTVSFL